MGIGVVGFIGLVICLYRTNKERIVASVREQVEKWQDISQKLDGVLANAEFEDFTDCKFENGARTQLRIQMDKRFTDNESYARQMKVCKALTHSKSSALEVSPYGRSVTICSATVWHLRPCLAHFCFHVLMSWLCRMCREPRI
jgi:hypothetical protein